jgi:hypothetical protein
MSLVFQYIDPPTPLSTRRVCPPPATEAGGTKSPAREGNGGSIFWKTRDTGLPSYSNNLSTCRTKRAPHRSSLRLSVRCLCAFSHLPCLLWFFYISVYSTGGFFGFFSSSMYSIKHCFICRPSDSTVSEDAGIEPRIVATSALAVRHSNHYARSQPHWARSHPH